MSTKGFFFFLFLICSHFLTNKPRAAGLKALVDCPLKNNFFAASLSIHYQSYYSWKLCRYKPSGYRFLLFSPFITLNLKHFLGIELIKKNRKEFRSFEAKCTSKFMNCIAKKQHVKDNNNSILVITFLAILLGSG